MIKSGYNGALNESSDRSVKVLTKKEAIELLKDRKDSEFRITVASSFSGWHEDTEGNRVTDKNYKISHSDILKYMNNQKSRNYSVSYDKEDKISISTKMTRKSNSSESKTYTAYVSISEL